VNAKEIKEIAEAKAITVETQAANILVAHTQMSMHAASDLVTFIVQASMYRASAALAKDRYAS
jgi:hypothetical protein